MSKRKHKITIDKRSDVREFEGKLYELGVDAVPDNEEFANAADSAEWTDDPGTGRAILLPDGREVINPLPVSPPVTYSEELSVNDLVDRALRMHFEKIEQNADAVEALEDLLHFDDVVDDFPVSPYEVFERDMLDEVPVIPVVPDVVPPAPPLEPTEKPPAS